jgi:hypothetical protein
MLAQFSSPLPLCAGIAQMNPSPHEMPDIPRSSTLAVFLQPLLK